ALPLTVTEQVWSVTSPLKVIVLFANAEAEASRTTDDRPKEVATEIIYFFILNMPIKIKSLTCKNHLARIHNHYATIINTQT
uniref:hypothetical protein n=1 Tax=Streptomyces turgidiscabies TaxID=85558 RepID=UPI0038F6C6D5